MRYTAIADVSRALTEMIRANTVPELIDKPDSIGLCSPAAPGDFKLGLYLYNVEESESYRISGRQNEALHTQRFPPIVLDLYYMITPYYKSDVKFLALEEQTILGKVIQLINDNSTIYSESGEAVSLELLRVTEDDKQKIWVGSNPYRTSVFISARAVVMESTKQKQVSRVTEITIKADTK